MAFVGYEHLRESLRLTGLPVARPARVRPVTEGKWISDGDYAFEFEGNSSLYAIGMRPRAWSSHIEWLNSLWSMTFEARRCF